MIVRVSELWEKECVKDANTGYKDGVQTYNIIQESLMDVMIGQ